MSLHDIIDNLIERVRSISPIWDKSDSFVCFEDASGFVIPIDEMTSPKMRAFDIRLDPAFGVTDDGIGGFIANRWRARLNLRVAYPINGDRGRVERIIGSDGVLITRMVMALPYPEGLESVVPPTPPVLSQLSIGGVPLGLICTYRIEVIYTEGDQHPTPP